MHDRPRLTRGKNAREILFVSQIAALERPPFHGPIMAMLQAVEDHG
jgi:hypothetical protein